MFARLCAEQEPDAATDHRRDPQSSVVTSPLNRPAVGNWNIGSLPTSTYTAGSRMAFALGALTEMSQSDLINLQRALQYPLSQRGINNV
jgi:hypothetical protein